MSILRASGWRRWAVCASLTTLYAPAMWAQTGQDALAWLQRVPQAARQLSYSGTFVFQNGMHSETSRIVHVATEGGQLEKLVVLDGSPREVLRHNDEVKCYLPESRLVVIEQRGSHHPFPALIPAGLTGLGEFYQFRKGSVSRVAGRDSQIVRLEPRDAWRYARQFWIDHENGLLLKAETLSQQGESLESISFTELAIGAPPASEAIKSGFTAENGQHRDWEVRQVRLQELREDAPWQFRSVLPGFRRQSAMLRSSGGSNAGGRDVLHWVFSDGLAAVSVFISPAAGTAEAKDQEVRSLGAIQVLTRHLEGYKIVVMGDAPAAAIQHFAKGITKAGGERAK